MKESGMRATKALSSLAAFAIIASGIAPEAGAAQFQRPAADRVCFYQDINYQGWEQCYREGDEVANLNGRRNSISSIRIFGRARVRVYEDSNFRGNVDEFTSSVPDLGLRIATGSRTWSDRIDSFQIVEDSRYGTFGNARGRGFGRGRADQDSRDGICVYEHADYQGRSECWTGGDISDLSRRWSDIISSVRVYGNATVTLYRDIGFRGERVVIDSDITDLSRLRMQGYGTWNDQASSLQLAADRNNRGRVRGRRQ
jgi:Peptidase inhibitor family I36